MSTWRPNFGSLYSKLIDETPLSPPPEEVNSPADLYKKTYGYRIRKSIVLAFNCIKLIFLAIIFLVVVFMDIEAVYDRESFKKAQIVCLVILPIFLIIQLVGFIGAIREKIVLTVIYWTFCLIAFTLTLLTLVMPLLIDFEDDILWRKIRDFLFATMEAGFVGWYLLDLYKLRALRKADIQMRPMSTAA